MADGHVTTRWVPAECRFRQPQNGMVFPHGAKVLTDSANHTSQGSEASNLTTVTAVRPAAHLERMPSSAKLPQQHPKRIHVTGA